jgi:hypothetical protein
MLCFPEILVPIHFRFVKISSRRRVAVLIRERTTSAATRIAAMAIRVDP